MQGWMKWAIALLIRWLSIRGTAPDGIFCVELSGANHRGAVAER